MRDLYEIEFQNICLQKMVLYLADRIEVATAIGESGGFNENSTNLTKEQVLTMLNESLTSNCEGSLHINLYDSEVLGCRSNHITYLLWRWDQNGQGYYVLDIMFGYDTAEYQEDYLATSEFHKKALELAHYLEASEVRCGVEPVEKEPLEHTYFINEQVGGYAMRMMENENQHSAPRTKSGAIDKIRSFFRGKK